MSIPRLKFFTRKLSAIQTFERVTPAACQFAFNQAHRSPISQREFEDRFKKNHFFDHEITSLTLHPYFLSQAALAAANEIITPEQYATASQFWSYQEQLHQNLETFTILPGKYTNTIYSHPPIIPPSDFCTFKVHDVSERIFHTYLKNLTKPFFNKEERQKILRKIEKEPPSEQTIFAFPIPATGLISWSPLLHRLQEVNYPFLGIFECPEKKGFYPTAQEMVFTSMSIYRIFMAVKNPEKTVYPLPYIGPIDLTMMLKFKEKNLRPVECPFPGQHEQNFKKADGFLTGGPGAFMTHDLYHVDRANSIPSEFQAPIKRIIGILNSFPDKCINQATIHQQAKQVKEQLLKCLIEDEISFKDGKFGDIFYNSHLVKHWADNHGLFKKLIIQDMAMNQHLWEGVFNITRDDLIKEDQKLFDLWNKGLLN